MTLDYILQNEEKIVIHTVEGITDAFIFKKNVNGDCIVRTPVLDTPDVMKPCGGVKDEPLVF
jgi:hypothetical protein